MERQTQIQNLLRELRDRRTLLKAEIDGIDETEIKLMMELRGVKRGDTVKKVHRLSNGQYRITRGAKIFGELCLYGDPVDPGQPKDQYIGERWEKVA